VEEAKVRAEKIAHAVEIRIPGKDFAPQHEKKQHVVY
jgi:hypothetical protein